MVVVVVVEFVTCSNKVAEGSLASSLVIWQTKMGFVMAFAGIKDLEFHIV